MTNETYFQLEGEFLGVCAIDGYKLKYLRLRTAERDSIIKVPKELRMGLVYRLAIGERLRCAGIQKDGKFKASTIEKIVSEAAIPTIADPEHKSKVEILICKKSHCQNNGGKEIYSALAEQLNSHNLNESVTLKSTGCLKCCKQSPNLVVLPVGTTASPTAAASGLKTQSSYRNVKISQVLAIISQVRYYLSIEPQ